MYSEHSAYPHPSEFKVMRPEYLDLEDGNFQAAIIISPFRVTGRSASRAGARRAALYNAEKTYRSYHPSYSVNSPFPDEFTDTEGKAWKRLPISQRAKLGDYEFTDEDGTDSTDIETMLLWDVRIAE